eukprot:261879-Rhodomonas_salina.1
MHEVQSDLQLLCPAVFWQGNLGLDHRPEGERERQASEDVRFERQPLGSEGGEAVGRDRCTAEGQGGTDRGRDEGAED